MGCRISSPSLCTKAIRVPRSIRNLRRISAGITTWPLAFTCANSTLIIQFSTIRCSRWPKTNRTRCTDRDGGIASPLLVLVGNVRFAHTLGAGGTLAFRLVLGLYNCIFGNFKEGFHAFFEVLLGDSSFNVCGCFHEVTLFQKPHNLALVRPLHQCTCYPKTSFCQRLIHS